MSQKTELLDILRRHGTVSMGYLADNHRHLVYRCVQRMHDLKLDGHIITHENGEDWRENKYTLVSEAGTGVFAF